MLELSIFVDESGDFGVYEPHAPVYLITLVLHDQSKDISVPIEHLRRKVVERGLPADHAIHTGPLIRREGEYKDYFHTDYKEQLSRGWEGQWRCLLWLPTEGKGLGFLKGLVTMVEESNAGYKFAPLFDEKTLKGKKVGLVLNQCEYMSGDQVRKSYFVKRAYRVSDIRAGKNDAPVLVDVDGREHKQNEPPTPSIELEHVDEVDIPF